MVYIYFSRLETDLITAKLRLIFTNVHHQLNPQIFNQSHQSTGAPS
jgi:hypothetical protein